jgi:hypothetical protein
MRTRQKNFREHVNILIDAKLGQAIDKLNNRIDKLSDRIDKLSRIALHPSEDSLLHYLDQIAKLACE